MYKILLDNMQTIDCYSSKPNGYLFILLNILLFIVQSIYLIFIYLNKSIIEYK